MSAISKASLVQIPSGYREDKLYSEVPNTAAGDLTFTRASTGTRVNSDGYIEEVAWNLMTYSEDFSNSSYIKDSGVTIGTTNNVSPIGNNTATQINVTDSGRIYKNVTSAEYRTSVYLKAGTFAYFKFVGQNIDLNLGTITSTYPSDIEDVGNGWYRISISYPTSIRPFQIQAYPDNTYSTHTTSGNYFIWGAMLNYGDTTKPYIKTTDRLDIPRLDYSGGASCPTLLLEPQRTNTIRYDSDYTQSQWVNVNVLTTGTPIVSPSGLTDGQKLISANTFGQHYIRQILGGHTVGQPYVYSVFAKAGELTILTLRLLNGGGSNVNFNLSNGTHDGGANGEMIDFGNGWYRCISYHPSATSTFLYPYIYTQVGNTQGDGVSGLYAWGAMLEQGTYSTSLINTTSTSVTRVDDVSETSGLSDYIGQSEGSFILDFKCPSGGGGQIYIWDGTLQNRMVLIFHSSNTRIDALAVVGNTLVANENLFDQDTTQRTVYGIRYRQDDFEIWVNGVLKATESGTFSFWSAGTLDQLDFNAYNDTAKFSGNINKVIFTTTYPTDDEMQELTTL